MPRPVHRLKAKPTSSALRSLGPLAMPEKSPIKEGKGKVSQGELLQRGEVQALLDTSDALVLVLEGDLHPVRQHLNCLLVCCLYGLVGVLGQSGYDSA